MPSRRIVRGLTGAAALAAATTAGAESVYTVTWIPEELGVSAMNDAGHAIGSVFTSAGPRIASWSVSSATACTD